MDVFEIKKPQNPLPLVFDSPHSGQQYPADFHYACNLEDLNKTEDHHVDDLFDRAPEYGGTFLKALFPRCYIDPNRAACDVDPQLLDEKWPYDHNPTSRSDSGIGLIRRLASPGVPIYDRKLTVAEIKNRIDHYHAPYHGALKKMLDEAHYNFGQVYHINCHSMPSVSAKPKQAIGFLGGESRPTDFCLGNRGGTSCAQSFTHAFKEFIKGLGYKVTINDPFQGVELVSKYSDPVRGRHSIQLEINKALYMDEKTGLRRNDYGTFKQDIDKIINFCASYAEDQLKDLAAD